MNDKQEGNDEQGQTAPTPPPPIVPVPPANEPPIPPINSQSAASPRCDERGRDVDPVPKDKLTKNDKVMIGLTVAIALGTIVSAGAIVMQWREMVGSGKQTDKIIAAAKINAHAAKQFAKSAEGINKGVSDAVLKLNLQANKLDSSVRQASRLAADTETANKNAMDADRPWMGGYISVSNFAVGSEPSFSVIFTNSGKRPAYLRLTANRENGYPAFPKDPDGEYLFDTTPSTSVVVPGQGSVAPASFHTPLSQPQMDAINNGRIIFFAFAKVEYQDIRTGSKYWTHICLRYIPKMKSDTDNGFRNCTEYNDAN